MFRRVAIPSVLFLGDLTLVLLATFLAGWMRPYLEFGKLLGPTYPWPLWPVYALAFGVWATGFLLLDVYNLPKNLRLVDELLRLIPAHVAATLAFAGTLYFSYRDISRLQVLTFAAICLALLVLYRFGVRLMLHFFGDKRYGARRVLVVGAGPVGREVAVMIVRNAWTGLKLVGFVDDDVQAEMRDYPHLGDLAQTVRLVREHNINEVVIALPRYAHTKLANLVAALQGVKVNVRVIPDFVDLVFVRSAVEDFGGIPLLTLREPVLNPLQRLIKRLFDLVAGAALLLLALPVMAVVALIIRFDSPGPVIFKQQRVGENGRLFQMYKFRTMVHDPKAASVSLKLNGTNGHFLHKLYDDPRVTRSGRFLRRASLDELPQLINVLKGDMSLVGPRPELPVLVERYEPWQFKRFEVPQGLTGWWQVNGRADKAMHLHTEEDLYYIKHYSLWLDVRILWRTIKAVIDRRGAY